MGVDNGLDIGPHAIDQQVHADFAGDVAASGNALTLGVNDDHIGGAHGAFAQAGWGDQNAVIGQADGEIAIHGGNKSPIVQHPPVTDDFFPVCTFRRHGYPSGELIPK
jgi:hypothetical protein